MGWKGSYGHGIRARLGWKGSYRVQNLGLTAGLVGTSLPPSSGCPLPPFPPTASGSPGPAPPRLCTALPRPRCPACPIPGSPPGSGAWHTAPHRPAAPSCPRSSAGSGKTRSRPAGGAAPSGVWCSLQPAYGRCATRAEPPPRTGLGAPIPALYPLASWWPPAPAAAPGTPRHRRPAHRAAPRPGSAAPAASAPPALP